MGKSIRSGASATFFEDNTASLCANEYVNGLYADDEDADDGFAVALFDAPVWVDGSYYINGKPPFSYEKFVPHAEMPDIQSSGIMDYQLCNNKPPPLPITSVLATGQLTAEELDALLQEHDASVFANVNAANNGDSLVDARFLTFKNGTIEQVIGSSPIEGDAERTQEKRDDASSWQSALEALAKRSTLHEPKKSPILNATTRLSLMAEFTPNQARLLRQSLHYPPGFSRNKRYNMSVLSRGGNTTGSRHERGASYGAAPGDGFDDVLDTRAWSFAATKHPDTKIQSKSALTTSLSMRNDKPSPSKTPVDSASLSHLRKYLDQSTATGQSDSSTSILRRYSAAASPSLSSSKDQPDGDSAEKDASQGLLSSVRGLFSAFGFSKLTGRDRASEEREFKPAKREIDTDDEEDAFGDVSYPDEKPESFSSAIRVGKDGIEFQSSAAPPSRVSQPIFIKPSGNSAAVAKNASPYDSSGRRNKPSSLEKASSGHTTIATVPRFDSSPQRSLPSSWNERTGQFTMSSSRSREKLKDGDIRSVFSRQMPGRGSGAGTVTRTSRTGLPRHVHALQNPCNPAKTPVTFTSNSRRWIHAFPGMVAEQGVHWDSLCAPAVLPLTTDFFPLADDLFEYYEEFTYTISASEEDAFENKTDQKVENLLTELIFQRLAQGFQLVTVADPASDDMDDETSQDEQRRVTDSNEALARPFSLLGTNEVDAQTWSE